MSYVAWASDTSEDALEQIGGKGANLAEMMSVGLPVPTAFFVTSQAFATFLDEAGIRKKITSILDDVDVDDQAALEDAAERVQELVMAREVPTSIRSDIEDAYARLGEDGDASVAIRSSATAEDLPEASFAGQQETFLHVAGSEGTVDRVQACWASLYTPRAIYYRVKNDFPHDQVRMGVVVQRMVEADRAGVLFTRHPTTGDDRIIVEAAWGLGEGVVSGRVSPDNYVLTREGNPAEVTVATKDTEIVRDGEQGTIERDVPADRREARVLDDDQLERLAGLARTLDDHYGEPQDVEWAFEDGELFVLQTRPVTTIKEPDTMPEAATDSEPAELLIEGLGASPGTGSGPIVRLESSDELDRCQEGDVLVTSMTTPDMVPAMRRASAIVTDEGGMTCHAAIVGRELGVPCVVGAKKATTVLDEGREVTVDGDRGTVEDGIQATEDTTGTTDQQAAASGGVGRVPTATEVKVNISMPEATERARATDADGVGLLRVEHIVLGMSEHPMTVIEEQGADRFAADLAEGIRTVAEAFQPRPVWVRTLDAPTDEFRQLPGGDREPQEANPMLGWRGIRRDLDQPDLLEAQFDAIRSLHADGFDNVGVMLPLVQHSSELRRAKRIAEQAGLDPDGEALDFGIMIETPASALVVDDLVAEGLDFVSFGTNDLTQYTLAVDRNNGNVADLFDEFHPGVGRLIEHVIETCNEHDVETSICGQAGSDPDFAANLVEWGISSISANIDAVDSVRETVAREEQRLILDDVRQRR
jgi:pyruvate,water dikinase